MGGDDYYVFLFSGNQANPTPIINIRHRCISTNMLNLNLKVYIIEAILRNRFSLYHYFLIKVM